MLDKIRLNRANRRKLKKDKDLVKELYRIIIKYLPELLDRFENLTDERVKNYVTYDMKVICVTRLFSLMCGLTTITAVTEKFDTEEVILNIGNICKQNLKELPYWETIQDVFENIKIDELREIQKYIVIALIRSKMFDKYRYNNCFQIIVDGTGLQHFKKDYTGKCIKKVHKKTGVTDYYTYVLEAKLVVGDIVISLDSEFIENSSLNTEKEKQDCEINAFKRMAARIKKNFPKYSFIITGDALYANAPIIEICENNKWKYIFNLKKDRLKLVFEDFEFNIEYYNKSSIPDYYLSLNQEYKKHYFNVFRFVEKKNNKTTEFNFITNLDIDDSNIKLVVNLGRKRWKIENEGFNIQKNNTFKITHACSRNDNAIKAHYFFIQFAHTIRQLLEKGSILVKSMFLKIKEVSATIYKTLTSKTSDLNNIEINFQLRFDT